MPTTVEADSTLTDRYQTTVPETVRRALRVRQARQAPLQHPAQRRSGAFARHDGPAQCPGDRRISGFFGSRHDSSTPNGCIPVDAG